MRTKPGDSAEKSQHVWSKMARDLFGKCIESIGQNSTIQRSLNFINPNVMEMMKNAGFDPGPS
jgi:hypothetical protein